MINNETTLDPINQDAAKACKESNPEPIGYNFNDWYESRGRWLDGSEYDDLFGGYEL